MSGRIQSIDEVQLRPGQSEVLNHLKNKESVFASLPTGYGKSLTYFLPAASWGWKVWVVSPLNSLIQDQAMAAEGFGIKRVLWDWQSPRSKRRNSAALNEGLYQIAFFSPERMERLIIQNVIGDLERAAQMPDLLVLDELHCFETWRGFRSSYEEILPALRKISQEIPILGLSATLSLKDGKQWLAEMGKSARTVSVGLGRENLRIRVSPQTTDESLLLDLLERLKTVERDDSCIIYCRKRFEADSLAQFLRSLGYSAVAFHAGRPVSYKSDLTQRFREGKISVLCATSAFGMGIDYPKVRKVFHLSPPGAISSLWQEAGRAGRDGKPAEAVIYFRRSDISLKSGSSRQEKMDFYSVWTLLWEKKCRKVVIGRFLGMQEKNCNDCDWCLEGKVFQNKTPWWLQNVSDFRQWVRKKIFTHTKKS